MRVRHIATINQLVHAGADAIAQEYLSIVQAAEHEFRDTSERDRYAALVRAWGQFAHAGHFAAAIADHRLAVSAGPPPVRPTCRDCGGDNLVRDASARWDEQAQDWTISGVYDSTYCDDCCAESDSLCNWVPLDAPADAAKTGERPDA